MYNVNSIIISTYIINIIIEINKQTYNSYNQLCSAVDELGSPGLIYSFLEITTQNTISKQEGSTQTLQYLFQDNKELLTEQISKLIPILYRYQYDPSVKIQNAMTSLWNTVVKNPKEMIEKHYKDICIELDNSLQHSNWRYRVVFYKLYYRLVV